MNWFRWKSFAVGWERSIPLFIHKKSSRSLEKKYFYNRGGSRTELRSAVTSTLSTNMLANPRSIEPWSRNSWRRRLQRGMTSNRGTVGRRKPRQRRPEGMTGHGAAGDGQGMKDSRGRTDGREVWAGAWASLPCRGAFSPVGGRCQPSGPGAARGGWHFRGVFKWALGGGCDVRNRGILSPSPQSFPARTTRGSI